MGYILLENGDKLLLESGDGLLTEEEAAGVTGTASITLGDLTLYASNFVSGTSNITLGDLTLSATGLLGRLASLDVTLDDLLAASSGTTSPYIVTDPADTSVIEFRDATFTVVAGGSVGLTYQWYETTAGLLTGETADSITFRTYIADDGNGYYCVVSSAGGDATSATATLTVIDANHPDQGDNPYIDVDITGPTDVTAPLGQPVTLAIGMSTSISVPPYTVEWWNDVDGLYSSGSSLFLTFTPGLEYHNSQWWVVVIDSQGYYGQSGTATMAIVPAQLELAWSVTDATQDTTVIVYQSIAWSLYDAKTDERVNRFTCPVRTHRGISIEDGHTYWIPFYDLSARCQRGPLVNDDYNRYYWTQDGQDMKYDTLQNLEWNQYTEGYDVGVPSPSKVPSVAAAPIESNADIFVTRAYVYTYVTVFGEEGPPSLPTVADGKNGGVWIIGSMLQGPVDGKRRLITRKNIYRTVPSETGTAEYHFVDSVAVNTTAYWDDTTDEEVAGNYIMESTYWSPPPEKLSGLLAHPNGFFIGFVGRDIYFSEPYRPHAWNYEYTLSTIGEIIGLGIFGTTVVVCTNSFPYTITGIHPAALVMSQHDTAEPCLSRYGIVSMPFGVYYPGPNGLTLASSQGFINATQPLMTKEEWQTRYVVKAFDAARYQSQYVAFYNRKQGIMFAPDEPMAALVDLDLSATNVEPDQIDSIFTDEYSGKTFMLDNCNMYEWNPVSGAPLEFDWTSMEFDAYDPVNFGACRIIWYSPYVPPTEEEVWAWRIFNEARIAAAPLHPLNFNVLNEVRVISPLTYDLSVLNSYPEIDQTVVQEYLDNFAQIKQTFHWGPLVEILTLPGEKWPNTPYIIMQLIVNEEVVYEREIPHTKMFRLPAGFKATRFRIRLRSNIHIQSVKLAETGKELSQF